MGSIKVALIAVAMAGPALVGSGGDVLAQTSGVEPKAGTWRTWVLSSGRELRLPPPPDAIPTRSELAEVQGSGAEEAVVLRAQQVAAVELAEVKEAAAQRDSATVDRIRHWDAGSPSYRWNELMIKQTSVGSQPLTGGHALRAFALLNIALHDAAIAAWDSKYAYRRPRPTTTDPTLAAAVAVPRSPSYPCEHAVAAGAASEIMAYLWPAEASRFAELAGDAARSRVQAGVQYPSDVRAGLALGRAVAARVIGQARADNSDATWTGTVPAGPGHWTSPAIAIAGATWETWVLTQASELRPGPPSAYDPLQLARELAEIKRVERTPRSDGLALGWPYGFHGGPNLHAYWNRQVSRMVFEDKLEDNAPRAARAYALIMVTVYDTWIAAQDAKLRDWTPRPNQLDPVLATLVSAPPSPSYPSDHVSINFAAASVLGYLFARESMAWRADDDEVAETAIRAGIHVRSQIEAARAIGLGVANRVIARARYDGPEGPAR